MPNAVAEPLEAGTRTRYVVVLLAVLATAILGAMDPRILGMAVFASAVLVAAVRVPHLVLAGWLATSPWLSYVIRYPEQRSILTFDRIVVACAVVGLLLNAWRTHKRLVRISLVEIGWGGLALVALASTLLASGDKGTALRTAVDAFVLPILLYYAIRIGFEAQLGARCVFFGTALLGLSLPWVGVWEFMTGTDALAFAGASIFRTGIVRANGPYVTDNSYAIIALLVAVFVFWYPKMAGLRLSRYANVIRSSAIVAAVFASLIPLFRAVVGAFAVVAVLPFVVRGRAIHLARWLVLAVLALLAALPAIATVYETPTFQDRFVDPSSIYSRLATYRAAIDIISDRPVFGVGLTNYHEYFVAKYGSAWYIEVEAVQEIGAEGYPHNNLLAIGAELGLTGMFAYLVAWIGLLAESARRRQVAVLALLIAYWLPGMTLQSGYYGDLNLIFFCLVGVLMASDPLEWTPS